MYKVTFFILLGLGLSACSLFSVPELTSLPIRQTRNLPEPTREVSIPNLTHCTHSQTQQLRFNPDEPMIVMVHGCNGSAGKFLSLANVFAFHGQQTICFTYNDRDSMMASSAQFIEAIRTLADHMTHPEITIIAHSQGGLIARKALIQERLEASLWDDAIRFRLITISSPFAGISAAKHCASTASIFFSLGMSIPICIMISGDKWYEITHASDFIQTPGTLIDPVARYVKIVTDEDGYCLYQDDNGACLEDDYLFSLEEQYHSKVDSDPILHNIEIKAGHMEIVGDENIIPTKLIAILQNQGIMKSTPPQSRKELARVLQELY